MTTMIDHNNYRLEKWKRLARQANARGDYKDVAVIIEILEQLFGDDKAAAAFYVELKQNAPVREIQL
jgi:hypothetical protein